MGILVTGGAGYIGSHFTLALARNSENEIIVLDDLSTGNANFVTSGAKFYRGDISDRNLVNEIIKLHKIDTLVHFAAKISVPESISRPLYYYDENTTKTRALIESCLINGVKSIIFSSTAAVYGEPKAIPVKESSDLIPMNPYGRSKLMSEWIVQDACHAHNARFVILRYFNVAGADPEMRTGQINKSARHLIKMGIDAAINSTTHLVVNGDDYDTADGSCIRDFIHVSDLAEAHLNALEYLNTGGSSRILNCGYGNGYSVFDVISTINQVSRSNINVKIGPRRAGDPSIVVAETRLIREILGWKPKYDNLQTIIEHAFAWQRIHS
ncbi:UDP-glucose 4-epimerase GalE [Methylobacterium sp. NFXW15]|uniref:UDP-glucose 4-epimerase GalE n=1 Tax=Methylobacterium sp. NFXW15 TaxID=2819512 RepID=UPI003CECE5CF